MPATYAHYQFGKKVYRALPEEIKEIIRENKPAYLLGLHGPDLFFYYRPLGKNPVNQLGVRMHREKAAVFFEKGRAAYRKRPSYVLLSYLCGFICHFMLDSQCHPYISRYMEEKDLGHMEIETDFDRYLMEEDGLDPVSHFCTRHLIRDLDTEEAIASLFQGIEVYHVDDSILGFHRVIRAMQCKSRCKAGILRAVFTLAGQKKKLGGLVMDGCPNQDCQESNDFLVESLNRAVLPAAREIEDYVSKINGKDPLSGRLDRNFE